MPDPQDPATRDASVLDWAEGDRPEHARVLRWYTECIALRRELLGDAPTRFADVSVAFDDEARWVVVTHAPAGRPASSVVVNLSGAPRDVPLAARPAELLLAWDVAGTELVGDAVRVPAGSVAVVRLT